jgi:hypothetical protein
LLSGSTDAESRWCSRLNRLPGTEWNTEVDLDVGRNRESLVGAHLFALIPGQGASQLLRQLADVGKRGNNSRRVLAGDLNEHREAANAPNEGKDVCVVRSGKKISFPISFASFAGCPHKRSLSGNSKRRSAPAPNGSVAFDALDGGQSVASKCDVVAASKEPLCRTAVTVAVQRSRRSRVPLWVQTSPAAIVNDQIFAGCFSKLKKLCNAWKSS